MTRNLASPAVVGQTFLSAKPGRQVCLPHRHTPRGLTLVEILAALFVLAVGLASVLAVVLQSTNMGRIASDRNNATILIPEAIADIERMHLITTQMNLNPIFTGELMDTVGLGNPGSNPYENVQFTPPQPFTKYNKPFAFKDLVYKIDGNPTNLIYWPMSIGLSRTMGQFPKAGPDQTLGTTTPAYRALYKIEPHPEWVTATPPDSSAFAGVYILTLTMYRDVEPGKLVTDVTKKLEQISDPVVVYLRDKKVRE